MKKNSLILSALIISAAILLTTQSTFALESTAQPISDNTPASSTNQPSTTTTSATTSATPAATSTSTPSATPPADNSTLNLSLDDALKYMETGNSTLQLDDSKIQIYDKQNQQALARQAAAKSEANMDEDTKKDLLLNYKRSQWNLDNAKHDRDDELKSLKAQITNEYENILALQMQEDNLKKQMANLDTVINQVNLQIKLGLRISSDIYPYNVQKTKLEAGIKSIQNNIATSMITLKQDIGVDVKRDVVLTSKSIEYTKFDDTNIDDKIAKAIENNYNIQKIKNDIDITQVEYDIDNYYEDSITADQVELSIEDKKGSLQTAPVDLEVSLRTAYNNLKTLEATIDADKLTVEADQININTIQQNMNVGKMSILDMIPAQNTLLKDQYTLQQDVNNYMTAATNFQNSLDD